MSNDKHEGNIPPLQAKSQAYDQAALAIKQAILRQQLRAAKSINEVQLALYFSIGRYVSENSRSGFWGSGAIDYISHKLKAELPGLRGFSSTNIKMMRMFYEAWATLTPCLTDGQDSLQPTDNKCLAKSSVATDDLPTIDFRQMAGTDFPAIVPDFISISFTHHCLILNKIKEQEERLYYIHLCSSKKLSVSRLKAFIESDDYHHRSRMPNNFMSTMSDSRMAFKAVEMFRDEYLLDFINVEEIGIRDIDDIDERVVENAIVHNVRDFIMTFGHGFSFIGNQFRIAVSGKEHFIDLLFFNRELSALVAIELKTGPFKAAYLGQLNLYLQLLDDFVKKPHENPSIGIILCKDAEKPYVEYAVRDYAKPMGVATYLTGDEVPAELRRALPDAESLKKLL